MADVLTGDKRQEANAALLEVDKGLRSPRPGEQCEAIVRFPSLMDRFPFPILINTAFLKLADIFRTGSNLLRLNILKVIQVTQKHLSKITSTDEFFRRIYAVIHSNDPIARALTLRLFAAAATLVAEKKTVHHSIQRSLESYDKVEVEAAIFASDALCQHSSVFASSICEKMATMVKGLKTPPDMKLKLIPVLHRMHHDVNIASQVREVCIELLESHPSLSFVTVILHTLTELSVSTLINSSDQIVLLMKYASQDSRKSIRQHALNGLKLLARKSPQSWSTKEIESLLVVINKPKSKKEKEMASQVLYDLSVSLVAVQQMTHIKGLKSLCFDDSAIVSAYVLAARCNIALVRELSDMDNIDNIMEASDDKDDNNETIEDLIQFIVELLVVSKNKSTSEATKVLLSSIIKLSHKCSVDELILPSVASLLTTLPSDCYSMLCKAVASLVEGRGGSGTRFVSLSQHLVKLVQYGHDDMLLPLSTMLLETHKSPYTSAQYSSFVSDVQPLLLSHIWSISQEDRFWLAYKIARHGTRTGFHSFSGIIYKKLHEVVMSLSYKQWLLTLEQFSSAQNLVASSIGKTIFSLHNASSLLYDCALVVKSCGRPCSLQTQLLSGIAALVECYGELLSLCVTHCTLLPPSLPPNSTILADFKEKASQFVAVSKQFSALSHSMFDADPMFLSYMQLLQQSSTLMSNVIQSLTSSQKPLLSPGSATTPVFPSAPLSLETTENFSTEHILGVVCNKVLAKAQSSATRLQYQPLSVEHLNLIQECAVAIISAPIILPPSFFVSFQSTSVQLALSPAQPSSGQPVTLSLDTHLTLKVEGVIQHSGNKIYRSPVAVVVNVIPKVDKLFDSSYKLPNLTVLNDTPTVQNDYFIAQFLLTFPLAGRYLVTIETDLVDEEGKIWHTGPHVDMNLVVDTDDSLKHHKESATNREKSNAAISW